ncbi:MAG: tRNA lysidine(34) synthetase TilS, partial [Muribaculaceae bacterium]|nr:tRNA lysidine(34) synthetase TilS [Muribaculaceae bacterium]
MVEIDNEVKCFMDACGFDKLRPVGVALSGGADSVALALALKAAGCNVVCLHVNFGLRGVESDADTEFCRDLALKHGFMFRQLSVDAAKERLGGESIEMACRRLRYDWFEQMACQEGLQCVAVAHHSDDNEETMMLNLLRGTGVAGLRGMQARRGIYVRPLLNVGRADIEAYLKCRGQSYRVDSSNLSNDYRRNAVPNDILPLIRRYFPDSDRGLLTTIAHIADVDKLLNKQTGEYLA